MHFKNTHRYLFYWCRQSLTIDVWQIPHYCQLSISLLQYGEINATPWTRPWWVKQHQLYCKWSHGIVPLWPYACSSIFQLSAQFAKLTWVSSFCQFRVCAHIRLSGITENITMKLEVPGVVLSVIILSCPLLSCVRVRACAINRRHWQTS